MHSARWQCRNDEATPESITHRHKRAQAGSGRYVKPKGDLNAASGGFLAQAEVTYSRAYPRSPHQLLVPTDGDWP
jgi:hypothetical protein